MPDRLLAEPFQLVQLLDAPEATALIARLDDPAGAVVAEAGYPCELVPARR